ncbi:hypothetical protein L1887_56448 [Cichorium endivia]|nr:hypothetical protein L1887_56448 [Cichorium endivia]
MRVLPCESPLETGKASRFCLLLPCRSQRIQFLLRKPSREAPHQHRIQVQGDRRVRRPQPLRRQCLPLLGSLHWLPRMFAAAGIGSRVVVGCDEVIPIALSPPLFGPAAWKSGRLLTKDVSSLRSRSSLSYRENQSRLRFFPPRLVAPSLSPSRWCEEMSATRLPVAF